MGFTPRIQHVFYAGVAVTSLHVIDDSFLQPQPGTSARDHLARGLVPLAAAALSVWRYGRARHGTRAILAFAWAVAALLSGTEAVYYSQHGGLAGDDYTGLAAMAMGPLLAAAGFAELWVGRRLDERLVRRYARRAITGVVALFLAGLVVIPYGISYVGAHVARSTVPKADLGAAHENVTLHTSDDLKLEGWYVPSQNRAAVIVFPGRKGTLSRARMLARHGYGVLLYDRRGEGQSQGDPDGWGWSFNKDIRAGIDFLRHRSDVDADRIAGIGLSVGGEMMLQTASETTDLAAVVAEGAGARTVGEEIDDASGVDKLLAAVSYGVRDLTNAVVQDQAPPANLKRLVPKISPRPVFFIHAGAHDVGQLGPAYYRAAGEPKQIWQAAGGHTQALAKEPREYERRVVDFLDRSLLR